MDDEIDNDKLSIFSYIFFLYRDLDGFDEVCKFHESIHLARKQLIKSVP